MGIPLGTAIELKSIDTSISLAVLAILPVGVAYSNMPTVDWETKIVVLKDDLYQVASAGNDKFNEFKENYPITWTQVNNRYDTLVGFANQVTNALQDNYNDASEQIDLFYDASKIHYEMIAETTQSKYDITRNMLNTTRKYILDYSGCECEGDTYLEKIQNIINLTLNSVDTDDEE